MRKRLTVFAIFAILISGMFSIVTTNNMVRAGFSYDQEEEKLAELENNLSVLRAEYIRITIDSLESRARDEGFVAVESPKYVSRDRAFASR